MRYLLTLGIVLLLLTPSWSQEPGGNSSLTETSYTSEDVTFSVRVEPVTRKVLISFSEENGPVEVVTLNAREWHDFCLLYQKACTQANPRTFSGIQTVGTVPGIRVSLEVPFFALSGSPGSISTPPDAPPVASIVLTHGELSIAVSRSLTGPLDSVIETAQREMGTSADSYGP